MKLSREERRKYIDELRASMAEQRLIDKYQKRQEAEARKQQPKEWKLKYPKGIVGIILAVLLLVIAIVIYVYFASSSGLPASISIPGIPFLSSLWL